MTFSKLTLAAVTALGVSASFQAMALDLYMDNKTKQLYAEPGANRTKLGSFTKVEEPAAAPAADPKELEALRRDLEQKTNDIAVLKEHVFEQKKDAAEVKLGEKGLEFESKDGNFKAALTGRLQVDSQVNVDGNNPAANAATATTNQLADSTNIRRARIGIEGTFFKNYDYKFEYDFSRGNGTAAAGITDAYINWKLFDPFAVKFGQFKEPFSLEEATSNRYLTFIERNMAVNSFSDNPNAYKVGFGANYVQERFALMTAVQTEPVGGGWAYNTSVNTNGNNNRNNGSGDTGWDITGRLVGRPWLHSERKFLHIGASGSYRSVNNNYLGNGTFNNGGMTFTATPDGNVDRTALLTTGNLTSGTPGAAGFRQVSGITRFAAESAFVYKSFSAQAEYLQTNINGTGYGNGETLDGYYGYVSYFMTGESRAYKAKTGAWDRIKPAHNFDMKNGWGAWEVAFGYDNLNLTDNLIKGGSAQTAKAALNWYPNSHMRMMANYIHVLDMNTTGNTNARALAFNGTNLDMVELRAQVDW
ncbi:OprO/OprP family phosphate-selective porin [Methylovulum psychrotolerans]|uniref:Porin n=1 Tax=Methylovulum psychrotolerans TaxID=1704499 RepID=A0A2S5CP78_9GAMM|nr:porin [Methylovulum psychrotolerans]POZ52620.1 porin [Methylovulum psychrotolerans]